jgi:hypothetical protein
MLIFRKRSRCSLLWTAQPEKRKIHYRSSRVESFGMILAKEIQGKEGMSHE